MTSEKYPYKHRDIDWLLFNVRVLQEAEDTTNPLYERLKFLAIFSSNLDEYFSVRVSRLRQLKKIDKKIRRRLVLKPTRQVKEILKTVAIQQERFGTIFYDELIPELANNHIHLISEKKYNHEQKEFASSYFKENIHPLLHSIIIDAATEETTFLKNNKLYFVVTFEDHETLGIINIPSDKLGRFVCFPSNINDQYITFLDDIIRFHIDQIFPDHKIKKCFEIKISRDAELYIEDEFEGVLAEKIKESLSKRDIGQPTRLLYDASMSKILRKSLRKHFELGKIDMMPGGRYHNFSDFFGFPDPTDNPELHFPDQNTVVHRNFSENNDYFNIISEEDQLVHFPYMSFDYVQNFINQAANDEQVTEIKISLYRVAKKSDLTTALLTALKNGKKVTVFIEAQARFDEENNLKWGKIFEEKGASVFYSYPKIKVHSKILLVKRKEDQDQKLYAYIGTGNFNAKTSTIYCDHGLFTADKKITKELSEVFDILSGSRILPLKPKKLMVSPYTTRKTFLKLINIEMENAEAGKPSGIHAKLNSLEDREIIEKLYNASNAGVPVKLLVRGFSCLIPGLKGISEHIEITSVVDRYLEHGRIYQFTNAGDPVLYIGSADWMTRNLDKRIEVLVPIENEICKQELKDILNIQLNDVVKARLQDGKNTYKKKTDEKSSVASQTKIREYLEKLIN